MGLREILNKITGCVLCGALIVGTMGITSFAASGSLDGSGSSDSTLVNATLYNKSGNTRYCNVSIRESEDGIYYYSICANGGNVSTGNFINTNGQVSDLSYHAMAYGNIYSSASPQSGVEWVATKKLK